MPNAPLRVFISYSRADSDFVDKLQADLQARNIYVWVDRGKLEAGRDWAEMIQSAIDRCQVVLVILSPDALASNWVTKEYSYAQDNGKPVFPVQFKRTTKTRIPMRLTNLHNVNFESSYEQGMQDLLIQLIALTSPTIVPPALTLPQSSSPTSRKLITRRHDEPVEMQSTPPLLNPDLEELYRKGLEANVDGDLERAAVLWGQILEQDPGYQDNTLKTQMETLQQNLRPIRIQRLRDSAKAASDDQDWRQAAGAWNALLDIAPDDLQAKQGVRDALRNRATKSQREGLWGEEIDAWEALLKLEPGDVKAKEQKDIAEKNQHWEYKYKSAEDFVRNKKLAAAKAELELLWSQAPYYGDPAHIARAVGAAVPPDQATVEATIAREKQEQVEATIRKEWEQEEARVRKEQEEARVRKEQEEQAAKQREEQIHIFRAAAEGRHREGAWFYEIAAWKKVLQLDPHNSQAQERIPIAEENQQYAPLYYEAKNMAAQGLIYSSKSDLEYLWEIAPYYGDPAGIAPKLGLVVPPSYNELKSSNPEQVAKNARLSQKRQQEKELKELLEKNAEALQQRNAEISQKRDADRAKKHEQEAKTKAEQAAHEAEGKASFGKTHGPKAYFIKYDLQTSSFSAFFSTLSLLIGLGSIVGAFTQNWTYAVATLVVIGLISYVIALHKTHGIVIITLALLISGGVVFALVWHLSSLQYWQVNVSQIWFVGTRHQWLNRQLTSGVILGTVACVLSLFMIFPPPHNYSLSSRLTTFWGILGLLAWFIIAILGALFGWGFGFGYGWDFSLASYVLSILATLGLGSFIAIAATKKSFRS